MSGDEIDEVQAYDRPHRKRGSAVSEVFLKIINMSLSASRLVPAALILRPVFRKAPKWVNVLVLGYRGRQTDLSVQF